MTLKQFLQGALSDVQIVEGSDEHYPIVVIIPSLALDSVIDNLSPALLSREVYSFEAIDKDTIKVYLKEEG